MTIPLSSRATLIDACAASFARGPRQTHRLLTLALDAPGFFQDETLAKHAERPALVCKQEKPRADGGPSSRNMDVSMHLAWDFVEFDKHIHTLTRGLVSLGVQKRDGIAVVMGNNRCAFARSFA